MVVLYANFSSSDNGFNCTPDTVQHLAQHIHWVNDTWLYLLGVNENINIADFCDLIQNGNFRCISLKFVVGTPEAYKEELKAALHDLKEAWAHDIPFPDIDTNKFINM